MLVFDEELNQWDEVTFKNKEPQQLQHGIASFNHLLIDSNYYIIGEVAHSIMKDFITTLF